MLITTRFPKYCCDWIQWHCQQQGIKTLTKQGAHQSIVVI
jgi:hypothetical protein